jgi:glycosyltransferase involved in cell wall biosynthesis
MKLLYFGNRSGQRGKYPTVQDELTPLFAKQYEVVSVSDRAGYFSKAWHMLFTFFKQAKNADVILVDTFSTLNFYYALVIAFLCRLYNKPYVNFLHGGSLPDRLEKNPRLSSFIFKRAHKLVAPSAFMQVRFKEKGYDTVLIPNMLHVKNYPYKSRQFKKANLFWLRSFRYHYNPLLAVQVLKELIEIGIEADLIMVGPDSGDGSKEEVINYTNKHNLTSKVVFTGLLSKEEWIDLSKDRNILLNTTNVDNTPVSVIECMALGLLIVSTNVGGLPFLLQHYKDAILVEPDDSSEMVNVIERAIKEEQNTSDLIFNARKKIERFDWKHVSKKWEALFNEINPTKI